MFTYMLTLISAAIFGALINRLRGGGVFKEDNPSFGTQKRRLVYASAMALFYGCQAGSDAYQMGVVFVVAFVTLLNGWGRPIGALGGWENKPLMEFLPLDFITDKTLGALRLMPVHVREGDIFRHTSTFRLRLWGFVWLTYWGLCTGGLLSLVIGNLAPLLSFGLMGVCYLLTFEATRLVGKRAELGWPASEYVFGGICFLVLM